jgi:hypothetical protein
MFHIQIHSICDTYICLKHVFLIKMSRYDVLNTTCENTVFLKIAFFCFRPIKNVKNSATGPDRMSIASNLSVGPFKKKFRAKNYI